MPISEDKSSTSARNSASIEKEQGSETLPSQTKADPSKDGESPASRKMPPAEICGAHTCYLFDNAKDSLVPLILERRARLVAFGEAHAPADFQQDSTVKRFTHELLPQIAGGSSHLLVELLQAPASGCEKEKKATEKESKEITKGQSANNQNEYLALGHAAHKLGVTPDILHATCKDLARIASKEGGVFAMMESIAQLSETALTKNLATTKKGRPLVLAYGGALHNDVTPRKEREAWSYGPAMMDASKGAYLEVDLIIPELIKDNESWRSFTWYDSYKNLNHTEGAVLMKWGDHSYSLFFAPVE